MIPKNEYGNVDVTDGVPAGFVHVPGKRLQPTCKALGIDYAPAFVGFGGTKRYPKALTDGVVVAEADASKLHEAIVKRQAKDTPESRVKRADARAKKYSAECAEFAAAIRARFPKMPQGVEREIAEHACKVGSGRIGRSRVAEHYGVDRVMAAVVAHIRHTSTDYDDRLADSRYLPRDERAFASEDAREAVGRKIAAIIRKWQEDRT